MTETTQPDPQVVAWMRGWLRQNPDADYLACMEAYRTAHGYSLPSNDLVASALSATAHKSRTVADIPAGQGPASLFIDRDLDGSLGAWFKNADGWRELVMYEPVIKTPGRDAIWDHLAATLPHVTLEETP